MRIRIGVNEIDAELAGRIFLVDSDRLVAVVRKCAKRANQELSKGTRDRLNALGPISQIVQERSRYLEQGLSPQSGCKC